MIRNVIFDMGGVLVGYRPDLSSGAFLKNAEDAALVRRELFQCDEWKLLDAGGIEEEHALARVCERLPQRLRAACTEIFHHWHEYLPPVDGMLELVQTLKAQGLKLYLCSNAALRFRLYYESIAAMALMDGILVSAEERCVKPDRAIYERLFDKFSLLPEECFFIDDLPANIEGGRACGMEGFVFDGNTDALRTELAARGILPQEGA